MLKNYSLRSENINLFKISGNKTKLKWKMFKGYKILRKIKDVEKIYAFLANNIVR